MIITVHAKTRAKKDEIVRMDETTFKISVTEVPEKGKANASILKILAKELKVSPSKISLARGHTIPFKQFEIE